MPTSAILKNMVELPGGTFRMGSKDFYPEERPVRDLAWRQLPVAPNRTTDRERA
jgi:formylglycine-generating enzyme required for sulfatase activity